MSLTKHQQIPAARASQPAEVQRFMDMVRQQLNMLGGTGQDRVLTQRDVKQGVLGQIVTGGSQSTSGAGAGAGSSTPVVDTPTQPTGLTGSVGEDIIFLKWDRPTFQGFAYTEVWRFDSDLLASATLIATVAQPLFSEYLGFDKTVYYWIRHVNTASAQGPYNATAGFKLTTKMDFAALQTALSQKIDNSYFATALRSQIDLLDATNPAGLVIGQQQLSQAQTTQQQAINTINSSMTAMDTRLKGADTTLQNNINAVQSALTSADTRLTNADTALNDSIALTVTRLGGYDSGSGRYAHIKTLDQATALLARQVAVLGTWDDANSRYTEYATLKQTTADSALAVTRLGAYDGAAGKYAFIKTLEQADTAQVNRISTLETDNGTNKTNITTLQTATATQADSIAQLQAVDLALPASMISEAPWKVGVPLVQTTDFPTLNGSNNKIITGIGPYNTPTKIWRGQSTGANGADGGFHSAYKTIDPTKTYRFSCWVRAGAGNTLGNVYLGLYSTPVAVKTLAGVDQGNPYFYVGTGHRTAGYAGKWLLLVGVVHPHTYSGAGLGIAGIYDPLTGTKLSAGLEFKAAATATGYQIRCYQYYCGTSTAEILDFAHPRMEVIDGTEPLFADLLRSAAQASFISRYDSVTATQATSLDTLSTTVGTQGTAISTLNTTQATHATAITRLGAYDDAAGKYSFIKTLEQADASQVSRLGTLESVVTDSGGAVGSKITRVETAALKGATVMDTITSSGNARVNTVSKLLTASADGASVYDTITASANARVNTVSKLVTATADAATIYDAITSSANGRVNSISKLLTASADGASIYDSITTYADANYNTITKVLNATKDSATKFTALGTYSAGAFSKITALETTDANQAALINQLVHGKGDAMRVSSVTALSYSHAGASVAPIVSAGATVDQDGKMVFVGAPRVFSCQAFKVQTSRTYRISITVRQTVDTTNGQGSGVYAGVATLDGNYQNLTGGAGTHRYCAAQNQTINAAMGTVTFTGTISGEGDLVNQFRPGTVYVRPMFILNYNTGNGTTEVLSFEIRDITDTAAVETSAKAYTDTATQQMRAEYTIKVQADGRAAGIGLTAGGVTGSAIYFSADKIAILPPSASSTAGAVLPFIYDAESGSIMMDTTFIRDLTASKIAGGLLSLSDGNIRNLSVFEKLEAPAQFLKKSHLAPELARELAWVDPNAALTGGSIRKFVTPTVGTVSVGTYLSGGIAPTLRVTGTGPIELVTYFQRVTGYVKFKLYRNGYLVPVNGLSESTMTIDSRPYGPVNGVVKYQVYFSNQIETALAASANNSSDTWTCEVTSVSLGSFSATSYNLEVSIVEAFGSTGGLIANTLWSTVQQKPTLNGANLDSGAAIVTPVWGQSRSVTIGATSRAVDGSANIQWTLDDIGVPSKTGTGASGTWGIGITGNAATATNATNATKAGALEIWSGSDQFRTEWSGDNYLKFRFGGASVQRGIQITDYDTVKLVLDRSGYLSFGGLYSAGAPTIGYSAGTISLFPAGSSGSSWRFDATNLYFPTGTDTRLIGDVNGLGFYTQSGNAKPLMMKSVLASDTYAASELAKVPVNGVYAKGGITTAGDISGVTGKFSGGMQEGRTRKHYVELSQPPANIGLYRKFVRIAAAASVIGVSGMKVRVTGGFNWVNLSGEITYAGSIHHSSSTAVSVYTWDYIDSYGAINGGYPVVRLTQPEILNGYLGFWLYCTNTGTQHVTVEINTYVSATTFAQEGEFETGVTLPADPKKKTNSLLRVNSPSGYIDIGSVNSNYAHFDTDRSTFYMGKPLSVNGAIDIYGAPWRFGMGGTARIYTMQARLLEGLGTDGISDDNLYLNYVNGRDVHIGNNGGARLVAKHKDNEVYARWVSSVDQRSRGLAAPNAYGADVSYEFLDGATAGNSGESYIGSMVFRPYGTGNDWSGSPVHKIHFGQTGRMWYQKSSGNAWGDYEEFTRYASNGYLYTKGWINIPDGTGLFYNSGTHLFSIGNGKMALRGSTTETYLRLDTEGSNPRGFVYADSSNILGFLAGNGAWAFKIDPYSEMGGRAFDSAGNRYMKWSDFSPTLGPPAGMEGVINANWLAAGVVTANLIASGGINVIDGTNKVTIHPKADRPLYFEKDGKPTFWVSVDGQGYFAGKLAPNTVEANAITEDAKKAINPFYLGGGAKLEDATIATMANGATFALATMTTLQEKDRVALDFTFQGSDESQVLTYGVSAYRVYLERQVGSSAGAWTSIKDWPLAVAVINRAARGYPEPEPAYHYYSYSLYGAYTDVIPAATNGYVAYRLRVVLETSGTNTNAGVTRRSFRAEKSGFVLNQLSQSSTQNRWVDKETGFTVITGRTNVTGDGSASVTFTTPLTTVFSAQAQRDFSGSYGDWAVGAAQATTTNVTLYNHLTTGMMSWTVFGYTAQS